MSRQNILKILAEHRGEIESRFGVASLSLFGSVARDEAAAESDVDILVTFVQTPGIFGFLELKEYLENLLQCSVDLVTKNALKKQFREQILQEALYAVDRRLNRLGKQAGYIGLAGHALNWDTARFKNI